MAVGAAYLPVRLQSKVRMSSNPTAASQTQATAAPQPLQTLTELPTHYKAVLLDQFGVLHDGIKPYPGAIEAVNYLHDRGLHLLIISNSSRRSHGALGNLKRMGFDSAKFSGVITSGEVTFQHLLKANTSPRTCLHFTWSSRGAISLEGLNLKVTTDPLQCDFILAHGTEALGTDTDGSSAQPIPLDEMKRLLKIAASREGPPVLIVANPDVVTVHGGDLRVMPGTLARYYQHLTGDVASVQLMGKPSPVIYAEALTLLDSTVCYKKNVIAIGDSLEHDIAGASAADIDSLFIAGGIHAEEVKLQTSGSWDDESLQALSSKYEAYPSFITSYFRTTIL